MAAPTIAPRTTFDLDMDFANRTLRPRGDLDSMTTPVLLDAARAFTTAAVGDLTIDLAQVTFADSALLHALVSIRTDLRTQGAGLWLVNEPSCVQRLFRASGNSAESLTS